MDFTEFISKHNSNSTTDSKWEDFNNDLRMLLKGHKQVNNLSKGDVISLVCGLNREPNECSVNLYTEKGCKTCRYFKQTDL